MKAALQTVLSVAALAVTHSAMAQLLPPEVPTGSVPAPAALLLLGIGAVALMVTRRK